MIHKILKASLLVVLAAMLATGCKKDSDDPISKVNLFYDTLAYRMPQAFFINHGVKANNDTTYEFDFRLLSADVMATKDTAIGTGQYLNLELESRNKLSPAPGIYKFNRLKGDMGIQNMAYGEFYDTLNFQSGTFVRVDSITEGTVVFATSGSTIIATMNFTTKNGKKLTGSYTGGVTYFEGDKKKK